MKHKGIKVLVMLMLMLIFEELFFLSSAFRRCRTLFSRTFHIVGTHRLTGNICLMSGNILHSTDKWTGIYYSTEAMHSFF